MNALSDEARILRERDYHNRRFTDETRVAQGKYYSAIRHGARHFASRLDGMLAGSDILEYGCGDNSTMFEIAGRCRSATGIDISDVAVQHANDQARAFNLRNTAFHVMNAEAMTFPDAHFDVVFGRGIIHHLDLHKSFREVARVLRRSGTALFWEPLGHNPLINGYRKATPHARTPDEHPLLKQDFDIARQYFQEVNLTFYGLTTLATVPFRDSALGDAMLRATALIDRVLFTVPAARWQAWYCVLELRGPKRD